ncbi:MAG: hypothetical protein J1F31_06205 [Erysipelotrichales bacterium]|nr:hypothetical protein [Erysipelotrichales bacterium]
MNYILFNPKANNNSGEISAEAAKEKLKARFGEMELVSLIDLDVEKFLKNVQKDDNLVLIGGDGTLNNFANKIQDVNIPCNLYMYSAGTGNDFLRDIESEVDSDGLALINDYVKHLPYVIVNEKKYYFINGVGFGIDGQVCEVADEKKRKGAKKISYSGICISLALFKYKFPNGKVIVDGVEMPRNKIWLASSMNGRFYGGGLMIAPEQNRKENTLTMTCVHGSTRVHGLMVFVSAFKGEHVKHKKMVDIVKAHRIEVTFDRPTALQIDGETILGVTHYVAVKE